MLFNIKLQDKVILITGASAGIGWALAKILAQEGAYLCLTARRADRLQALAGEINQEDRCTIFAADVAAREDVKNLVNHCIDKFGRLDILVNNAGAGCVGRVADIQEDLARRVFDINFFGALNCIQEVVPKMRKQGGGHIINVSSVIGKRSIPDIGLYCATKFALNAIGDSLRIEGRKNNIHVTTFCPGLTDTEFSEKQIRPEKSPPVTMKYRGQSAEYVAKRIVRAAKRRSREVHLTPGGNFLITMERLCPWLVDQMMYLRHIFVNRI